MSHGQHLLSRECVPDVGDEFASPRKKVFQCLYVVGPCLTLEVRDEAARESSPVTFAQQWCLDDLEAMGLGNDPCRIYRPFQVAGDNSIEWHQTHLVGHLLSLQDAIGSQLPLRLSLHDLSDIIDSLAMSYQV